MHFMCLLRVTFCCNIDVHITGPIFNLAMGHKNLRTGPGATHEFGEN